MTVYLSNRRIDLMHLGRAHTAGDIVIHVLDQNVMFTGDIVEYRSVDRHAGPTQENIAALLLHLFQHQIHHRGQAHVQLQSAGIAPPQLDEFHLQFNRAPSARKFDN